VKAGEVLPALQQDSLSATFQGLSETLGCSGIKIS